MSLIQRVTTWYWLALHTAIAQRVEGTCGGSPRRLPRYPGFDYSEGYDPGGGATDVPRPFQDRLVVMCLPCGGGR